MELKKEKFDVSHLLEQVVDIYTILWPWRQVKILYRTLAMFLLQNIGAERLILVVRDFGTPKRRKCQLVK